MAERTCVICASTFTAQGGTAVTCGNPDCQRLRRNERMREFFRAHKERTGEAYTKRYRTRRSAHSREYMKAYWERTAVPKDCWQCGTEFAARTDEYRFCSRSCAAQARANRSCKIQVVECLGACGRLKTFPGFWQQRSWRCDSCKARPMFQAGRCRRCDEYFVMPWNNNPCHYCSDRCQKRDSNSTRRVRKRDAFVAPVYRARIFERDDWRCQICKKKVRRNAVVPHPLAPVLDHITPLADGGTHEPANVQCAHYLCNSVKSHGAANDQLRLIG